MSYVILFYYFLHEVFISEEQVGVHFVLDPIGLGGTSVEASFAARYSCLVTIENVSLRTSIYLYALSFMLIHSTFSLIFAGRKNRNWSIGPDKRCRSSKTIGVQKGWPF